MPKQKNDLLTLLFFIVGLLAVVDLVYVSVKQKANEEQADKQLSCIADVVAGARDTIEYNGRRDAAIRVWLQNQTQENREALTAVLGTAPPPLSDCEIDWK